MQRTCIAYLQTPVALADASHAQASASQQPSSVMSVLRQRLLRKVLMCVYVYMSVLRQRLLRKVPATHTY